MKKQNRKTLFISIGMLIVAAGYVIDHFTNMPDAMDFIKGLGVGVVIMSFFIVKGKPEA